MEYDFEKFLREDKMELSVIDARRFAKAIRTALNSLKREGIVYNLIDKTYYIETIEFLEQQLARLEAGNTQHNHPSPGSR